MRNSWKPLLLGVIVAGAIGFGLYQSSGDGESKPMKLPSLSALKNTDVVSSDESFPEYSIPWLRNQVFDPQDFVREELSYETVTFEAFTISYESDGLKQFALMSIPKSPKPVSGYPVLILNHGYIDPEEYSTVNSYKGSFDYYASQGYIVIKPDYRGHGQSEGEMNNPLNRIGYPVDIMNVLVSVKNIPEADENNIFMWGHSMGGDITLKVLEATNIVRAASLWAPVSEDFPESTLYFVRKNRTSDEERIVTTLSSEIDVEQYELYSVRNYTHLIETPIITHHGTEDESVPYEWSVELDKAQADSKAEHSFYTYQGENHNFTNGARSTVLKRDIEYFESHKQ